MDDASFVVICILEEAKFPSIIHVFPNWYIWVGFVCVESNILKSAGNTACIDWKLRYIALDIVSALNVLVPVNVWVPASWAYPWFLTYAVVAAYVLLSVVNCVGKLFNPLKVWTDGGASNAYGVNADDVI